jgi:hypothetical protein
MKAKREEIKINFKEEKQEIKDKLKLKRQEIKKQYDNTYTKKYGKKISNLDQAKVEILIGKIDALVVTVNTGAYSDEAKVKMIAMLDSFKELATKRLDNLKMQADLDLDSLFQ